MKLPRAIFAIVPLAILLLPLGIYFADRATSGDEVARNVTVAGVSVGGMSRADATLAVEAHENRLRTSTGVFTLNGQTFKLSPLTITLQADVRTAIDAAFAARRDAGVLANLRSWLSSFSTPHEVPLALSFDADAIAHEIESWEREAIPNPAFNGGVAVIDGVIVPQYPRPGHSLDHAAARRLVVAEMSTLDKRGVTFEVLESTPILTAADIDVALQEMTRMVMASITLISTDVGFRVVFQPEHLVSAVRAELSADDTQLLTSFDPGRVLEILEPRRAEYEIAPVDAKFDIDIATDDFTIVPGRDGTLLDIDALVEEMKQASLGSGFGSFPLLVGSEPSFTTEDATAFTTLGPLAGFTTEHPGHEARVANIQTMADDVNGAIVLSGDEWSLNAYIGERTQAKGYIAAPVLIDGMPYCCDHPSNIGGGVSQFSTTLFNAVFFSCLEDVVHQPHSLYLSRYPMGREATLGLPNPDMRFKNNTDHPLVIATAYTETSITVKIYGDNGGLTCTDDTHEMEDVIEFGEELVADEEGELDPGQREKIRSGIDGFFVKVDRIVTYPDGSTEIDLRLTHRYRPLSEQYLVHPCEVTGEPVDCPVKLGSLLGITWEQALSRLEGVGLRAQKEPGFVDSPSQHNIVLTQSIAPGDWVQPGTVIRLTVGDYSS